MALGKCKGCGSEKELHYCLECQSELFLQAMTEKFQGDVANRVKWMMDEKLEQLENNIKELLKDKQIVCIKRGKKMTIV